MGYWYLATPYTNYPHGHDAAHEHACQIAGQFIRAGVNVFCPIAHSHHLAQIGGLDHMDGELWKRLDAPYLENARGVIVAMMDGWAQSAGVSHEIERAREICLTCLAGEVIGPNPMPHTREDFRVRMRESTIEMVKDIDLIVRVHELDREGSGGAK